MERQDKITYNDLASGLLVCQTEALTVEPVRRRLGPRGDAAEDVLRQDQG
jgi:hypothetical protein